MNMRQQKQHTVIISFDAVYEADFAYLKTLPNIAYLLQHGSYSTEVQTIYPTITYPIHTSILTGCYPDRHGIFHNHHLQPTIKNDKYRTWHWYHSEIKAPTLLDVAKQHKKKVGAIFWPVTGNAKIDYNLPEIIALPGENQTLKILKAGTPMFLLKNELKYKKLRKGIEEPYLADFATKVATNLLKTNKPDVTFLHLVSVDTMRHGYGVTNDQVMLALKQYDKSVGEIMDVLKESKMWDHSSIFITTDHGQIDVKTYASVNAYLVKAGLQQWVNGVLDYQVYAQSIGMGAYLHFNYNNITNIDQVLETLDQVVEQMIEDKIVVRLDTKDDLIVRGCSEPFDASLEAYPNTYITDSVYHEFGLSKIDIKDITDSMWNTIYYDRYFATHGYDERLPGYKNIFIAYGPKVKTHYNIGPMHIVDIAPTIANLIGLTFPECDGKLLATLRKEEV